MTPDWAACCHLANDFKTLDRFFKILPRSALRVIFYKQELNCCPACRTSSASKEVHKHFWTSAHFPFLLINLINIASVGANNIFFLKMDHSEPLVFFIFVFSNVQLVDKTSQMSGLEPRISGVGSDRSTNWATTTAQQNNIFNVVKSFVQQQLVLQVWKQVGSDASMFPATRKRKFFLLQMISKSQAFLSSLR